MTTSTVPTHSTGPSSPSTIIAVEDEDGIENAVFQEKHGPGEPDIQSNCIDGLLCCVRSRCLGVTCILFPSLLFLIIFWSLPATATTSKLAMLIMTLLPPGLYVLSGIILVVLVCRRQIQLDTENAQAAHRYLHIRSNLKKVAVSRGGSSEVTVAGRMALFLKAAKEGDIQNFRWCIGNGQNVDEVDYLGRSALHWATMSGQDEIVDGLLRNGASIDLRDTAEGLTPLHYAAFYGHVKITRMLVTAGADMTLRDNRQMNPLQLAEMASLKLASVQPTHQMIIKFLRIAMKDTVTPPLQHITGLTVANLVERQMMGLE